MYRYCAGFGFVFKAPQWVHTYCMCPLRQHRKRIQRQARLVHLFLPRPLSSHIPMAAPGRLAALIVVFTLFALYGCGKKAPPVAPSQAPLVGVTDLAGGLNLGKVRLTWTHPTENAKAVGYIILRAQSVLSKPDCPDCPQLFQKVAAVPIGRSLRKQRHPLEFYQDLATGFKYTFKVRPYESSGGQGPDSNRVIITHPKTGPSS